MKILVPTGTHPSKNSSQIIYVKNILKNLEKAECIWFLYETQKTENRNNEEVIVMQDYQHAIEVLEKIKPDCVITNNNKYDVIDYSFSLAANFLNIPLINYKVVDLSENEKNRDLNTIKKNFQKNFQKLRSVDPETKKSRRSFIINKNKFLFQTEKVLGKNDSGNVKSQFENILFHFIGNPKKRFTNLADMQLINNEIWWQVLSESGIDEKKMQITGNPYWDTLYNTLQNKDISKEPINQKPLRILILTTPMLEHGLWTEKQRKQFFSNLIEILKNQVKIEFSLKIHPSSEKLETYEKYLQDCNVSAEIFQTESIWDIIDDFDIIISYGYTTTHSEIALVGFRMILLETEQKLREMPFTKSGIESGFIKKCQDINELPQIIKKITKEKIHFHENHENEIKRILYKFDGKSGKRAADIIKQVIDRKNS